MTWLGDSWKRDVEEAWALAHNLPYPRRGAGYTGPGTLRSGRFTLAGAEPGNGLDIVWHEPQPGTRTALVGCDDGSVWVETTYDDWSTERLVTRTVYDLTDKRWHPTETPAGE